ncbi:MAG: hypothetical protein RL272_542 [Candidatus Parcubacteria bacterium]|jgi:hypothetical protein
MGRAEKKEHLALLAAILAILVAAETVGGGSYFFQTRLIRAAAFAFTVLPLIRAATNFRVYDPTIVRVTQTSLAALAIFAESHVIAFAGGSYFGLPDDTAHALVANLYIAGLLTLIIGSELALGKMGNRPKAFAALATAGLICVFLLCFAYAGGYVRPSLAAASNLPLAYAVAISLVAASGFLSFTRLGGRLPLLRSFVSYFLAGCAFLVVSAVFSFFALVLAVWPSMPIAQAAYAEAFSFMTAVSLMFLAFGKLRGFGGIYKDIHESEADA